MDTLIQASLSGSALGCVYSLGALGFVLIYKATGVLNFAQGELMMVGAYIYFSLVTQLGLTPLLAFGATLVLAGLLGALIERLVLHPLVDEPPFTLVMVTIGLATDLSLPSGPLGQDRTIMGTFYGAARPRVDFHWLLDMYMDGRLKVDELITRYRPLDEVNEAFDDMNAGVTARTVLTFG